MFPMHLVDVRAVKRSYAFGKWLQCLLGHECEHVVQCVQRWLMWPDDGEGRPRDFNHPERPLSMGTPSFPPDDEVWQYYLRVASFADLYPAIMSPNDDDVGEDYLNRALRAAVISSSYTAENNHGGLSPRAQRAFVQRYVHAYRRHLLGGGGEGFEKRMRQSRTFRKFIDTKFVERRRKSYLHQFLDQFGRHDGDDGDFGSTLGKSYHSKENDQLKIWERRAYIVAEIVHLMYDCLVHMKQFEVKQPCTGKSTYQERLTAGLEQLFGAKSTYQERLTAESAGLEQLFGICRGSPETTLVQKQRWHYDALIDLILRMLEIHSCRDFQASRWCVALLTECVAVFFFVLLLFSSWYYCFNRQLMLPLLSSSSRSSLQILFSLRSERESRLQASHRGSPRPFNPPGGWQSTGRRSVGFRVAQSGVRKGRAVSVRPRSTGDLF